MLDANEMTEQQSAANGAAEASPHSLNTVAGQVLFMALTGVLLVVVVFWNDFGNPWGPGVSAFLAVAFLAVHIALVRTRASAIDPVVWLPVCIVIYYFGVPIALEVVFAHPPAIGYDPWQGEAGPPRSLHRGYALALLTLVSYLWGTHVAGVKDMSGGPPPPARRDQSLVLPGYALTFGGIAMSILGIALVGGPSVVFGYYADWWAAKEFGADARFIDVGLVFTGAGCMALIASFEPRRPARLYVAASVTLLVMLAHVMKGSRASLVTLGIAVGWCFTRRVRKVGWTPVLAAAAVMFIAMPIIGEWRDTRSVDEATGRNARDLVAEAIYGMGSQVLVFGYMLDVIPHQKSYIWGESYWNGLLGAIPNLGTSVGKSWGVSTIDNHPGNWVTNYVTPTWYENGGGYGSAMGAEFYFNWGFLGVALGPAVLGFVVGRFRNAADRSALALTLSALVFAFTAQLTREQFGSPFRNALWAGIAIAILRWAFQSLVGVPPAPAARKDDRPLVGGALATTVGSGAEDASSRPG